MFKLNQEYLFAFRRFTLSDGSVIGIRNDVVRYWGRRETLNALEYHKRNNPENFIERIRDRLITQMYSTAVIELNFCKFHNYLYSKELQLVLSISKHFETKYYCNSIYETLDFPAYQFLEKQYAIQ